MRELSLHIMDIVENGVAAGATLIEISVKEERKENRLRITVKDNGRGIPQDAMEKVFDPFYTSRKTRRVGLGLSLFREASRRCGGDLSLRSKEGEGTETTADFQLDHLDLAPMGDVGGSMATLIMGNPEVDFVYSHEVEGTRFSLDTREVRNELDGVPMHHPEVIRYLADLIRESVKELYRTS